MSRNDSLRIRIAASMAEDSFVRAMKAYCGPVSEIERLTRNHTIAVSNILRVAERLEKKASESDRK